LRCLESCRRLPRLRDPGQHHDIAQRHPFARFHCVKI